MKKIALLSVLFSALTTAVTAQQYVNQPAANIKGYQGNYAIPFLYDVHKIIFDYIYNGYPLDTDSITDLESGMLIPNPDYNIKDVKTFIYQSDLSSFFNKYNMFDSVYYRPYGDLYSEDSREKLISDYFPDYSVYSKNLNGKKELFLGINTFYHNSVVFFKLSELENLLGSDLYKQLINLIQNRNAQILVLKYYKTDPDSPFSFDSYSIINALRYEWSYNYINMHRDLNFSNLLNPDETFNLMNETINVENPETGESEQFTQPIKFPAIYCAFNGSLENNKTVNFSNIPVAIGPGTPDQSDQNYNNATYIPAFWTKTEDIINKSNGGPEIMHLIDNMINDKPLRDIVVKKTTSVKQISDPEDLEFIKKIFLVLKDPENNCRAYSYDNDLKMQYQLASNYIQDNTNPIGIGVEKFWYRTDPDKFCHNSIIATIGPATYKNVDGHENELADEPAYFYLITDVARVLEKNDFNRLQSLIIKYFTTETGYFSSSCDYGRIMSGQDQSYRVVNLPETLCDTAFDQVEYEVLSNNEIYIKSIDEILPVEVNGMLIPYMVSFAYGLTGISDCEVFYDKWGYSDQNGRVVIPLDYDFADLFYEETAMVGVKSGDSLAYGFIDKSGKKLTETCYEKALHFKDGLAAVKKDGSWGFIDKTGKEVISCKYDEAHNFSEGLAAVKILGKWGFINTRGEMQINAIYESATDFYLKKSIVGYGGFKRLLSSKGKLLENEFEEICGYNKKYIVAVNPDLMVYKTNGKLHDDFGGLRSFENISNNIVCYMNHADGADYNKFGYMDMSGITLIKPKFDWAGEFSCGLAPFSVNDKYGYINLSGEAVIEPVYFYAGKFNSGFAQVNKNQKVVYWDSVFGTDFSIIDLSGKTMDTDNCFFLPGEMACGSIIKTAPFGYVNLITGNRYWKVY